MAISAYILKIVEKDPFLRLQMTAKEMFNRHQLSFSCYGFSITKELTFGLQILDLKDHFSASLIWLVLACSDLFIAHFGYKICVLFVHAGHVFQSLS